MKRGVYIAVPALDGYVRAELSALLSGAERLSLDPDYPLRFHKQIFTGYRPVEFMRNSVFAAFLSSDCERLWMLDSDIMPPDGAFGILDEPGDIVGGMVTGHTRAEDGEGIVLQLYAFSRRATGEWDTVPPPEETVEVDAVAGGCMVIHRQVLEDDRMRLDADVMRDRRSTDPPALYRIVTDDAGRISSTGDVDLCWRARALGYSVKLWAGEMFGQRESLDLRDVAAFGARCASSAREGVPA